MKAAEQCCKNCKFWERDLPRSDQAACKRNAPRLDANWQILQDIAHATGLLLWWYVREHNGDGDQELVDFGIKLKGYDFDIAIWPRTDSGEWCGEWQEFIADRRTRSSSHIGAVVERLTESK